MPPETQQVLAHEPSLLCGCDALFVAPLDTRDVTQELVSTGFGQGNPFGGLADPTCGIWVKETMFEVHISRCVYLPDPTENNCHDDGSCSDILTCDENPPPPRPENCEPAATKALESYWLLRERQLLETCMAGVWEQCLCEGWCTDGACGDGCAQSIKHVSTRRFDSGGCGGSILLFRVTYV